MQSRADESQAGMKIVCLVAQLCLTLCSPWSGAHQAFCPWGFFRQEYWSGLPCPPSGDLPNPEIEPRSPALRVDSLLSEPPRNEDCWEKYQQPPIYRGYYPNGRKQKWTKETLDESERGEQKAGLKLNIQKNEDHGIRSHHFMANRWGNNGNSGRFYFLGLQNHCGQWLQPQI